MLYHKRYTGCMKDYSPQVGTVLLPQAAADPFTPDIRLLPGEQLMSHTTPVARLFTQPPSSLQEVLRLTRVGSLQDIGQNGPSVAALAINGGEVAADAHLRLYEALFGRDSLRVAMSLMAVAPQLARATIQELARQQGTVFHASREEEPGRIVHEVRNPDDPVAQRLTAQRGWGWPYYGTVDATPEFIRTLAAYCRTTRDYDFLQTTYIDRQGKTRTIAHALNKAVDWIEHRMEQNPERLLEHKATTPGGIENQVWKDSWDSYMHADGTIANHHKGIAAIEVQAAVYDALIDTAELMEGPLAMEGRALQLRLRAETLKTTVMNVFWTDDKGGYFVLGTDRASDGSLRPLKVRSSNMGHVLQSRLMDSTDSETVHKRQALVRQLVSPELLGAAGVQTLASDEARYRPGSYHNGSVWLWDSHYIAGGLRRHGYEREADDIDQRILDVVHITHMLPEYVRGGDHIRPNTAIITVFDTIMNRENTVEQLPQEVQAWTAAAVLEIKTRLGKQQRLRMVIQPAAA